MDRLLKNYGQLTEYLETTPDLRQHAVEAPPLKAASKGVRVDGWISMGARSSRAHRASHQADPGGQGGRQFSRQMTGSFGDELAQLPRCEGRKCQTGTVHGGSCSEISTEI